MTKTTEQKALELVRKLKASPKYNTYENYGQKEIRKFLDSIDDYREQGRVLEIFYQNGF